MDVTLVGTKVTQNVNTFAFEKNNGVDVINVTVDTDESWNYKLDVNYSKKLCSGETLYNVINLERAGNVCSATLTSGMLPFSGRYIFQLRGINSDGRVYHSEQFNGWVKYSIDPGATYDPMPSEFYQIENNISEINNHPPYPDNSGYWMIYNPTKHEYELSDIAIPTYKANIDIDSINGGDSTDFATGIKSDILTAHMQMRSDTEEIWTTNDPLLMLGELGLTTDGQNKGRFKIGDGQTAWSSLAYYGGNSTSDNNYVTVDMIEKGDVSLPINNLTQDKNTILVLDGGDANNLAV